MDEFKAIFDGTFEADFSEMKPVPVGEGYGLRVMDVQAHESRKGRPTMRVMFEVETAPPGVADAVGKKVVQFYTLHGPGVSRLAALMKALGVSVPEGSGSLKGTDFIDGVITADIKHREYEGVVRAEVVKVRPRPQAND